MMTKVNYMLLQKGVSIWRQLIVCGYETGVVKEVTYKWDKVFKSGLSKFCGRQTLICFD